MSKLETIWALAPKLRRHGISRVMLYKLRDDGLPMVGNKTTKAAVLQFVSARLETASPEQSANLNHGNGCNENESGRSHDRIIALPSSGQSQRGGSVKQKRS